jgi:surface protein
MQKLFKFSCLSIITLFFVGCGGGGSSSNPSNNTDTTPPVFTSSNSVSVNENQTSAITLVATDTNTITYSVSGTDANSFNLDASSGVVTFKTAPDFESGKVIYTFKATATDSSNNSTEQNVSITILDVAEDLQAQLIDSAIQGVSYTTNSKSGVTDENGYFTYAPTDTNITFKVGSLTLADFNLSNLNSDKKLLPTDIVGVNRNDTTNANVNKFLRVVQSLDNDNNPSNGILIDDNTKNLLTTSKKVFDSNISELKSMIENTGKKFVLEKSARDHFKSTLSSMGVETMQNPFVMLWEVKSHESQPSLDIKIPINPNFKTDYNYTVDWGDGNISSNIDDNATHTYTVEGNYTVSISGKFPAIYMQEATMTYVNSTRLRKILSWGDIKWKSMKNAFAGCTMLEIKAQDIPDLSSVSNMSHMFWYAEILNQDINDWNVSNVTDMNNMFHGAKAFNNALDNWNVSKVTNMSYMFNSSNIFNQNIGEWNTTNVTDMSGMFVEANSFNQDLSNWDTSSVIQMNGMFADADSFSNQDLSSWNVNKVTDYSNFMTDAGTGNILPDLFQTITHNDVTYGKVYSPHTGKIWLDRNLGATKVCTKSRDEKDDNNNSTFADDAAYVTSQEDCFGDYYQWGRDADGHEKSNSTTTAILATDINLTTQQNIVDNNGSFITNNSSPYDWLDVDNNDIDDNGSIRSANWSKTDGSSICPIGFRVPTIDELKAETIDLTGDDKVENRDDAFNSFLKLPVAGYRDSNLTLTDIGSTINISTSSIYNTSSSRYLFIDFNNVDDEYYGKRANGFTVRCIKD